MNVFNRALICLILFAFILVTLLISLLPKVVIDWLRLVLDLAEQNLDPATQLAGAVLGLAVAVAAFLLLVVELGPPGRQSVVVAQVAGGTAELTNASVALRIKRTAESIPSIREATPVIHSRGKSVDIALRLFTDPDIDLPQKSEEVMQAVRAETENKIGVPVRSLRVTVRHAPHEARYSPSTPGATP